MNPKDKVIPFLFTLVVAILAGALLYVTGMVLPWLLGPLLAVIVLKITFPKRFLFYWPIQLRSLALLLLGIQLGASFTSEAANKMATYLPYMALTTVLLIGFTLLLAFFVMKLTGISSTTALLGSFPGGLSQMVIVGEEMERANESVIMFMQTLRILLVLILVPLVANVLYGDSSSSNSISQITNNVFSMEPELFLLLLALCPIGIWLGKKINMPIPFMLIPLLIVAVAQTTIIPDTTVGLPTWLLNGAQLSLGAHLGYNMKIDRTLFTARMVSVALGSNVILLAFSFGISELFSLLWATPFKDLFLAVAPGGIAEMSVTALTIHADTAYVVTFQLFRVLFILLIVTPTMKWILEAREARKLRVKESA
ncbi:AbrB family transcriptional regulator [Aquibacillus sp. 3ASR75-11]|uniref:AbrB family transcriptional regulator n=1 Tax=Terrihalobacillus insolitus TaxID=2950438 RepID=A0A9X3WP96_9BACI|nr:AbrB family transcriptional regulator [Terrihalobacillus insolitus]MDC3411995.1 AbrB family transcriptional regulator [Terrihalobacillus insolitus]MDC3423320.1 AbrB family transcriptional regulator [Terrihalobacillus insolitus]